MKPSTLTGWQGKEGKTTAWNQEYYGTLGRAHKQTTTLVGILWHKYKSRNLALETESGAPIVYCVSCGEWKVLSDFDVDHGYEKATILKILQDDGATASTQPNPQAWLQAKYSWMTNFNFFWTWDGTAWKPTEYLVKLYVHDFDNVHFLCKTCNQTAKNTQNKTLPQMLVSNPTEGGLFKELFPPTDLANPPLDPQTVTGNRPRGLLRGREATGGVPSPRGLAQFVRWAYKHYGKGRGLWLNDPERPIGYLRGKAESAYNFLPPVKDYAWSFMSTVTSPFVAFGSEVHRWVLSPVATRLPGPPASIRDLSSRALDGLIAVASTSGHGARASLEAFKRKTGLDTPDVFDMKKAAEDEKKRRRLKSGREKEVAKARGMVIKRL